MGLRYIYSPLIKMFLHNLVGMSMSVCSSRTRSERLHVLFHYYSNFYLDKVNINYFIFFTNINVSQSAKTIFRRNSSHVSYEEISLKYNQMKLSFPESNNTGRESQWHFIQLPSNKELTPRSLHPSTMSDVTSAPSLHSRSSHH